MSSPGTRAGERGLGAAADDGPVPQAVRVRGPRWKDARLVVGLLLVLVSVAAGVRVFAAADRTTAVWVAAHDLDAGSVLGQDDLVERDVRLLDVTAKYVSADSMPAGYTVTRPVGKGELLPSAAVRSPGKAEERRLVTVPVGREHLPAGLSADQRVDVYVTPQDDAGSEPEPSELVVAGAVVAHTGDTGGRFGASSGKVGVALSVPPGDVGELIDATRHGDVDLVRLPLGSSAKESRP